LDIDTTADPPAVVASASTSYAAALMISQRKLKFAVLAPSHHVAAWAAECVRHLLSSERAELVLFIRNAPAAVVGRSSSGGALYRWYRERWLERRSQALKVVSLDSVLAGVDQLTCTPGTDQQSLAAADVVKVRGYDLDFILSFGAQPLRGDILDVPRAGVWSFRHDLESAPYFRELLSGNPRTRAALDRLIVGGRCINLHEGFFGTSKGSWVNNLDRAAFGAADFCARACAKLSATDDAALRADVQASEGLKAGLESLPAPTNRELLEFLVKAGAHGLGKLWELLFHVEVWNVGFSTHSVEQILRAARVDPKTVRWCPPHKADHFIADPFAYDDAGEQRVLVEDYVLGKGRICELSPTAPDGPLALEVTFDHPYHMSFPCTFTDAGELYCVPETYQLGKTCLYRRVKGSWELVRTLLEGQPVVDPTLLKQGDLYWLFFTLQDDGYWGNLKLYAYYSEKLDGDWKPHLLNPIKCDIGSSRPAGGVLFVDGELYRPSQDCSQTYGGAVVINRVSKLSPHEFEEVEASRIEPLRQGPYPAGLHTINAMGSQSVFDSKKFQFDWLAWRKNWGRLHEVFK
jgi:hypothetical protein